MPSVMPNWPSTGGQRHSKTPEEKILGLPNGSVDHGLHLLPLALFRGRYTSDGCTMKVDGLPCSAATRGTMVSNSNHVTGKVLPTMT